MKYSPLPSLKRVWMDVDFSAGLPGRDIDDAMAMLQVEEKNRCYIVHLLSELRIPNTAC